MTLNDSLVDAHFAEQKKYLQSRGIDTKNTTKLQLEFVTATKLEELGYRLKGMDKAILWNIRDIHGEPTGAVGARVFYQSTFGVAHKGPKFAPPPDQKPRLYFSPLSKWQNLKHGSTIVLAESYLKADILAMLGYNAIGVSGCWGWSIERQLNDDFYSIPWKDLNLKFVVSFDSNVGEGRKPELNLAVSRLTSEMERLGVDTWLSQLPPPDDSNDWGIDDFYVANNADAVHELFAVENLIKQEGDIAQHLRILNREVGYVHSIDRVVRLHDVEFIPMTVSTFKTGAYANRSTWSTDAKGKMKKIKLAQEWMEWDERRTFEDIVYLPGQERIIKESRVVHGEEKEIQRFNVWRPSECEPENSEEWEELWTSWLEIAFPNEEHRHWFASWWAYQVQNPGSKMSTSLVMLGESGVGKGWVTMIMKHIFGWHNTAATSLEDIAGDFNSQFVQKQLAVVEEAMLPERGARKLKAKLKDLITNPKLTVNTKGVPVYEIDNHLNLFIQSNDVDAMQLDHFDRRFAVFDIVDDRLSKGGSDYWTLRWEALDMGLPEAVLAWLEEYDCGHFEADTLPPQTQVKNVMYEAGLNAREEWVDTLRKEPDAVLPDSAALYTAGQLEYLFQGTGEDVNNNQARAMAKTLARYRFNQVTNDKGESAVLRGPDGRSQRWWYIRECDMSDPQTHMSKINMASLK